MTRDGDIKSIVKRIGNAGNTRGLDRRDAFVAYGMDRLLSRLGRSRHGKDFILKGGVLVAHFVDAPYRFTRDIDTLRRCDRPDPNRVREIFREIVSLPGDDALEVNPRDVRAKLAERATEGYDGVTVLIAGLVGRTKVELKVDIGYGDDVYPDPIRIRVRPFLEADAPAAVWAYSSAPVLAEKIQTLLSGFPAVRHRLKDLLDVVVVTDTLAFHGPEMSASLARTCARRKTPLEAATLDDMRSELRRPPWPTDWATMLNEKRVEARLEITDAFARFELFVKPLIVGPGELARWTAGGPWERNP